MELTTDQKKSHIFNIVRQIPLDEWKPTALGHSAKYRDLTFEILFATECTLPRVVCRSGGTLQAEIMDGDEVSELLSKIYEFKRKVQEKIMEQHIDATYNYIFKTM